MLVTIIKLLLYILIPVFNIVVGIVYKIIYYHWDVRKTYQTFLYRFNSYHEFNLIKRQISKYYLKVDFIRLTQYTCLEYWSFFKLFLEILEPPVGLHWYLSCWLSWIFLTLYLYFDSRLRDLGPSYDIYDYNPDDNMGVYRTAGPFVLLSWLCWTWVSNITFIKVSYYYFNKLYLINYTNLYWYTLTFYSFIEMQLYITSSLLPETSLFILYNYSALITIDLEYFNSLVREILIYISVFFKNNYQYINLVWFPWESYSNIIMIITILYLLILLSIYNTENNYYSILYFIFFIFLVAFNLVIMDVDIFAGLLLLIESVVILMLFFLVIYVTPNVTIYAKISNWKIGPTVLIFIFLTSIYNYNSLGEQFLHIFTNTVILWDNFYEALFDVSISEFSGVYVTLYLTNSIVLLIIGLLLLVASVICVILVSFFTTVRTFNYQFFLQLFSLAKTCYSIIFLRKQNLSKQGRTHTSTRIFKKKNSSTKSYNDNTL